MFPRFASLLFLAVCSSSALANDTAYRPAFHPDQLKGPPAGRPNEVLVLGSPHLSSIAGVKVSGRLDLCCSVWKPGGPPRSQWRTCPACSVTSCAAIRPDTPTA